LPTIQACALGMDIARIMDAGIDPNPFSFLLHTTKEFSMAQSKSKRAHARASAAGAGGSKRTRRTRNAGATGHGSRQQRSVDATTTSTRKKGLSGAPAAPNKPTPRRTPSEYDPESGVVEPGGDKKRRGGRSEETIDEETGAVSKRPGGTGDVSFGDDEDPEGPSR